MMSKLRDLKVVNVKLVETTSFKPKATVTSAKAACLVVAEEFSSYDREVFGLLNLNTKGDVLNLNIVSIGALSEAPVHPREVFKASILSNAAGVILFHNHPSGLPTPSRDDVITTRRMQECGDLLGIPVLDHVVVASNDYVSINSLGLMDKNDKYIPTSQELNAMVSDCYGFGKDGFNGFEVKDNGGENVMSESLKKNSENVLLKFPKEYATKRVNKSTGEEFNSVGIPSGVKLGDKDIGGYSFNPLYVNPGKKNPNLVFVPVKHEAEVWLRKTMFDDNKQPVLGEDGKPIVDIVKANPAELKAALEVREKEYKQERQNNTQSKEETPEAKETEKTAKTQPSVKKQSKSKGSKKNELSR